MGRRPVVTLGMPAFNSQALIGESVESVLAQTYTDFELVVSDNASTDETRDVIERYAAEDGRIRLRQNPRNLGMLANFRLPFEEARGRYFAWVADHDLWHPEWLANMVDAIESDPQVVLTYPLTVIVSGEGEEIGRDERTFDTVGLGLVARTRATCQLMGAVGDRVYGLFRTEALARTSIYPEFLMPDRVLLLELALHGTFKQVHQYLRYRRHNREMPPYLDQMARQRRVLFPDRAPPWHSQLPTLGVGVGVVQHVSVQPRDGDWRHRLLGPYMAGLHMYRKRKFLREELQSVWSRGLQRLSDLRRTVL